jgi:hypothetical protein
MQSKHQSLFDILCQQFLWTKFTSVNEPTLTVHAHTTFSSSCGHPSYRIFSLQFSQWLTPATIQLFSTPHSKNKCQHVPPINCYLWCLHLTKIAPFNVCPRSMWHKYTLVLWHTFNRWTQYLAQQWSTGHSPHSPCRPPQVALPTGLHRQIHAHSCVKRGSFVMNNSFPIVKNVHQSSRAENYNN